MGTALDIILTRRSIRKYTEDPVPPEQLDAVLQAGLLAPTSQNRRPCRFVVVRDRDLLAQLSKAKKAGAGMLADAAVAIVVTADGEAIDTWVEDCSIALAYMHLEATALGLGSCWVQMHLRAAADGTDSEEAVRRILGLEPEQRVVGILSLGVPAQTLPPYAPEDADYSKVSYR